MPGDIVVLSEYLEVCEQAAHAGAQKLLEWQGRVSPKEKGPKDVVTEADYASQDAIQAIVLRAFPDHRFLGEESRAAAPRLESDIDRPPATEEESPYCWVVDPLDGTSNYVHGIPSYAVSVALAKDWEVLVGTVFNPTNGECFTAARGGGAFRNGARIQPSPQTRLGAALIAVSFAAHVPRDSIEVRQFVEMLHACNGVRRMGSAALNLCYVACGRFDGYYSTTVKPWDVAAGVLLLTEAGGCLSGFGGRPFRLEEPRLVCAATSALHAELLEVLARAE
jgi:myo-inositol-1(or 4)-monophosphatase